MSPIKTVIMGAAGRDFHNFNVAFRDDDASRVIAFTATQIPNIEGRIYPPELAGALYPEGIPIRAESDLPELIADEGAQACVFSYSDVSHEYVMTMASRVLALGADFRLLGSRQTMLESRVPVVAVCAVRTGCGKSQTSRRVAGILREQGRKVVVIRHPMPYGNLVSQRVQRFAELEDLERYECTIEEREEYEPHLRLGVVVYAGVDYAEVLARAEEEADVILWDGGNNDLPFYLPTVHITVTDPHRAGHELRYYPGFANLLMADVVVINKIDTAEYEAVKQVRRNVQEANPEAVIVDAVSPLTVSDPTAISGRRVLIIEDGPTLTHGEMPYGAGAVATERYGAAEVVDPRPMAVGSISETFDSYPHLGAILPAMGYGKEQIAELEETINQTDCDVVVAATPIDLTRLISINKPLISVRYELQEIGRPTLDEVLVQALPPADPLSP